MIKDNQRTYPFFKPDWSPYLFRSMDFLSPFCLIKKHIFNQISLETEFIKYLQYDVLLKCIEITNKISHVALPLCSVPKKSLENKNQCNKKIVQNHLDRIKIESKIEDGIVKNSF